MLSSLFSKPYSRLFIVGDNADWVIDYEVRELLKITQKLGIKAKRLKRAYFNLPQAVHYASQFSINEPSIYRPKHRLSVDYYHGKPEQGDNFKRCFESLKENHAKFSRVRVSTREMETLIKSTGIDPEKVMRIPIGVDTQLFQLKTAEKAALMRKTLEIPLSAFVIGSFQKDGVGWGEGNEPKLIKGPDIFLEVIDQLKKEIPNLFVLLSGPSRGYVKNGLEKLGVPYVHKYVERFEEVAGLYDALDLYLITSREEGGPKACLEAMAKGVPLVTTDVGQCKDLVISGQNGLMAAIGNVPELSSAVLSIYKNSSLGQLVAQGGIKTAAENSYESQLPIWREYFSELMDKQTLQ
jgi:glycosyltransferase involved in cell wall biosynthesis